MYDLPLNKKKYISSWNKVMDGSHNFDFFKFSLKVVPAIDDFQFFFLLEEVNKYCTH
jgi:hypothetical protein